MKKLIFGILIMVVACVALGIHMMDGLSAVQVTFVANGGEIAGDETLELKRGDALPSDIVKRDHYEFTGWYTRADDGDKVEKVPEDDIRVYAHWVSANKDRNVRITGFTTDRKDNAVRISKDETRNVINVSFVLSRYYGQAVSFVEKDGEEIEEIPVDAEIGSSNVTVTATLPDNEWMDRKKAAYYVKSEKNTHVDASKIKKLTITLKGQSQYFDKPIEGSTVWYGGEEDAPDNRTGVILATDKEYVYAKADEEIYKWEKKNCMINLPDVLTEPVYDIYNAYNSRFFPIKGKCMYSDNGGKDLKRYDTVTVEMAMSQNRKIGKQTFMVPVQWDFAEVIAKAQSKARAAGFTLYIVDTFRPMNSVDPVAKAVGDRSLLAYGGSSAHNFGFAVDCGWQEADENGNPIGEPYVQNIHVLDKKKAIQGPNGNNAQEWWDGVKKLPQEWWHYGDSFLPSGYIKQAKNVGELYVNKSDCYSCARSMLSPSMDAGAEDEDDEEYEFEEE